MPTDPEDNETQHPITRLAHTVSRPSVCKKLADLPSRFFYEIARFTRTVSNITQNMDNELLLGRALMPTLLGQYVQQHRFDFFVEGLSEESNTDHKFAYDVESVDRRFQDHVEAILIDLQNEPLARRDGVTEQPLEDSLSEYFEDGGNKASRVDDIAFLLRSEPDVREACKIAGVSGEEVAEILTQYVWVDFKRILSLVTANRNLTVDAFRSEVANVIQASIRESMPEWTAAIARVIRKYRYSERIAHRVNFNDPECEFGDGEDNASVPFRRGSGGAVFKSDRNEDIRYFFLRLQGGTDTRLEWSNTLGIVTATCEIKCSRQCVDEVQQNLTHAFRTAFAIAAALYSTTDGLPARTTSASFVLQGDVCDGMEHLLGTEIDAIIDLTGTWAFSPATVMEYCWRLHSAINLPRKSIAARMHTAVRLWSEAISIARPLGSTSLLAASIESVLGKKEEGLSDKLATRVAVLLESDRSKRSAARKIFKSMYNERSRLLHGESFSLGEDVVRRFEIISAAVITAVLEHQEFLFRGGFDDQDRLELLDAIDAAALSGKAVLGVSESPARHLWDEA